MVLNYINKILTILQLFFEVFLKFVKKYLFRV